MMPAEIQAEAAVCATGRFGLFGAAGLLSPRSVTDFVASASAQAGAVRRLESLGFTVLHAGPVSVTVSGPPALFERGFRTSLAAVERGGKTLVIARDTDDPAFVSPEGSPLDGVIAGAALYPEPLGQPVAPPSPGQAPAPAGPVPVPSRFPPEVPYYHITAPEGIVSLLNAGNPHDTGVTGAGVKVAVVDTGCYAHPYFERFARPPRVVLGPGASAPEVDEVGHGTMVTANVMTLAPDADVTVFKLAPDDRLAPAAFKMAVDAGPAVIENTWGYDKKSGPLTAFDRIVAALIAHAVASGIVVVFAGGNGKTLFPSQLPDLIAVGGVYTRPDGVLEAASYASGDDSALFPGRIVPDFCGAVGMRPEGVYLMLPTQPGGIIDTSFAASPYPEGDGTAPADGWVCISGTSAGSAQTAGVSALLRQVNPWLASNDVKALLARTARRVVLGQSAEGNPAGPSEPNLATGWGLVDAAAAVSAARASRQDRLTFTEALPQRS